MNRDELLTKLAMELEEWPKTTRDAPSGINALWCLEKGSCPEDSGVYAWATHNPGPDDDTINEYDWIARRTELIKKPSWDDAPEWAQWRAQDDDGEWGWYSVMPTRDDIGFESSCDAHEASPTGAIPAGHNWRDTLEPRPQVQSDIKKCKHCDITFQRPHVDGIPDDRCTRCDDEIKALWPEPEPAKSWWTSKTCTQCGHATAAKVSDDKPVCPGCVALSYSEAADAGLSLRRPLGEQRLMASEKWARGDMEARSKYHREIKPGVWVDVYNVLQAWGVKNPALQHLIKKALAPGERGHKTLEQDMNDIVASAKRAKELEQ